MCTSRRISMYLFTGDRRVISFESHLNPSTKGGRELFRFICNYWSRPSAPVAAVGGWLTVGPAAAA